MGDVRVQYDDLKFDISYVLGDFETDEGLETAVLISLFSDQRVLEEELPRGETERRGYWGDTISDFFNDRTGSKLWLLDRGKSDERTRNKVQEYAQSALQWLLDDGVASALSVSAQLVNRERVDLDIEIDRPQSRSKFFYRFQLVWDGQLMKVRRAA